MADQHASDLIKDLSNVPSIIGGLGLSIASAQKAFDVEYLDSIERILALAKQTLGGTFLGPDGKPFPEALAFLQDMLMKFAPSRYQFTETTLSVRLDLAQSLKVAGSVGLGFGIGAISINAAFTLGYSYDYQAAAECKTVIKAYPMDPAVFKSLLDRAATLNDKSLELPPRSEVDQTIFDKNAAVYQKITGQTAQKIVTKPSISSLNPATAKAGTAVDVTVTSAGFDASCTVDVFDSSNPPKNVGNLLISNLTNTTFKITLPTTLAAGAYQLQIVSGNVKSDMSENSKFTLT
jgi:hypothetical protein